jgi:transaldolase
VVLLEIGDFPKWPRKTLEKCDVDLNPQAMAISVIDCSACSSRFCARFNCSAKAWTATSPWYFLSRKRACGDAGAFLISPFVGRITDWHSKVTGQSYAPEEDPGVLSVRRIYDHYKQSGVTTVVMGASFRTTGQIEALAGCDRLTISPELLSKLADDEGTLKRRLLSDISGSAAPIATEPQFRREMNEDAMATEKLAEGIRSFNADAVKLAQIVRTRMET